MRIRIGLFLVAALATVSLERPAHAAHHLWRLKQAYSDPTGNVQFVELFTTDGAETNVGGQTVVGGSTFTFPSNLTGSTSNTWLLLATAAFQAQTGLQPDGVIPANFLSTGGGTLNYASSVDTWNYGTLPVDGTHMLLRAGNTVPAVATNFAGQSVTLGGNSAPALPAWAIVIGSGLLLFMASGLLRRQPAAGRDTVA